jgi:hypothetical protein
MSLEDMRKERGTLNTMAGYGILNVASALCEFEKLD